MNCWFWVQTLREIAPSVSCLWECSTHEIKFSGKEAKLDKSEDHREREKFQPFSRAKPLWEPYPLLPQPHSFIITWSRTLRDTQSTYIIMKKYMVVILSYLGQLISLERTLRRDRKVCSLAQIQASFETCWEGPKYGCSGAQALRFRTQQARNPFPPSHRASIEQ